MPSTCTHPLHTVPRVAHVTPTSAAHVLGHARAGLASWLAALLHDRVPADRVYGDLLAGSGGKLTDSLEREADRRLRDSYSTLREP